MCPFTFTFHFSFLWKLIYKSLCILCMNELLTYFVSVCRRVTVEIRVLQVHLVPKEMAILAPWWESYSAADMPIWPLINLYIHTIHLHIISTPPSICLLSSVFYPSVPAIYPSVWHLLPKVTVAGLVYLPSMFSLIKTIAQETLWWNQEYMWPLTKRFKGIVHNFEKICL